MMSAPLVQDTSSQAEGERRRGPTLAGRSPTSRQPSARSSRRSAKPRSTGTGGGEARPIRERIEREACERVRAKAGSKTPIEILRERIEGAYAGRLPPEYVLTFDDPEIGDVTVATVLSDPERYAGETLADPLEGIGYGPCKAMVMPPREDDDRVSIHSFAHGEMNYTLLIDQDALREMIKKAPRDQAVEVFVRNVDRAALFAGGEEALLQDCQKASGSEADVAQKALKVFRAQREASDAAQRKKRGVRPKAVNPGPCGGCGAGSDLGHNRGSARRLESDRAGVPRRERQARDAGRRIQSAVSICWTAPTSTRRTKKAG